MNIDVDLLASRIANKILEDQNKATPITFEAFSQLYMENYAKPRKRTWTDDESRLRNHLLPILGGRALLSISRPEIAELHARIGLKTPYAANRVLEQLGKMFRVAQLWGYYPEDRRVPTAGIEAFKETPRETFVEEHEMRRLAASIEKVKAKHLKVLFWCCLLTGLRRNELLHAKWSDISSIRRELHIAPTRSKNGKSYHHPLSPEVMALLDSLPRRSEYVFVAEGSKKPVNETVVWRSWDRVRRRARLTDIRIHDLRRTAASWIAQSGQPLALVGKVLHHSSLRATEIYARFAQNDVRGALEAHADKVCGFMS